MMLRYSFNNKNTHPGTDDDAPKERLLDAVELVDVLLPRCLDHPRCYNLISNAVQKLQKEADDLSRMKAYATGREYQPMILPRSYILFLPCGSTSMTPDRDSKHLFDVLYRLNRAGAREKAQQVKKILDEESQGLARKGESSCLRKGEQSIQELLKALPHFSSRPHVYNLIIVKIQILLTETRNNSSERPSIIGRLTKTTPIIIDPSTLNCKLESRATAEDRWMDVMLIDDVVESFPCIINILKDLKVQCQNEAKSLQKGEAARLMNKYRFY